MYRNSLAMGGDEPLSREMPRDVARKLGYYVYVYVHPRTGKAFYVGKGKGRRVFSHLRSQAKAESRKQRILRGLENKGLQPRIDILAHGLDEQSAFLVEMAVIDLLGLGQLVNRVRGLRSALIGRVPLQKLIDQQRAKRVQISDPLMLIRISQTFRYDMASEEIYNVTNYAWRVDRRRAQGRLVLAVYDGVVQEVFQDVEWRPAAPRQGRPLESGHRKSEFVGRVASPRLQARYKGRSVEKYFRRGYQGSIRYLDAV